MQHRPRITFSGYYGFDNAGDEAVLAGLVKALRAHGDEIDITALSIDPAETAACHGIRTAHRYRPSELLPALARTDLLLSGGGSLLQDVTSAHGIFYYLAVIRMAQILGKKTMFVAQGIGPLVRPRSRRLVAAVANRANAITVRDRESAELLRTIGVTRSLIEVTADPALLLTPTVEPTSVRENHFAVALRPWAATANAIDDLLIEACRTPLGSAIPIGIAMQPHADGPLMEQFLTKWHQITGTPGNSVPAWESVPSSDPLRSTPRIRPFSSGAAGCRSGLQELTNSFAEAGVTLAMRLHALILSAACGVPSVGLSYDPKVGAFMTETGQGDAVISLANTDPDVLAQVISRVWKHRAERAAALRERLPALRAAAQRNGDTALALLNK